MDKYALTAPNVLVGQSFAAETVVVIDEDGLIDEVIPVSDLDDDIELTELDTGYLVPGFVDLQVNGGGGVLFNEEPTVEGILKIAAAHRRFGTTSFLPTVITDHPRVMSAAANAVTDARGKGHLNVLGIHIEGPFIDPARKGAHDLRFIRQPTKTDIIWLQNLLCGEVLVTLAPNCVTPGMIEALTEHGVAVTLGHSDATFEEAQAAIEAGASGFTHLYNAMSQMTGRKPGMVGAALAHPDIVCGIIADGHHVTAAALKIAIAAKEPGKIFFVSDAMPCAAGGPSSFELQGRRVDVVGGRLQLADGTLAGANITMLDAVRYGVAELDLSLEDALSMASLYPAQYLGLEWELGDIDAGSRADLVHLSDELDVLETWVMGVPSDEA